MPKTCYFLEKSWKNHHSAGDFRSQPSVGLRRLGLRPRPRIVVLKCYCNFLQTLVCNINSIYYCYKRTKCAYFSIYDGGPQIFLPPGCRVPSYATGNMTSLNVTSFSALNVFSGGATVPSSIPHPASFFKVLPLPQKLNRLRFHISA